MNKESVVIAGECLRFIMLLQMYSNVDKLQKGFMSLFLESVLVVFSKTSDGVSQVPFIPRPVNSALKICCSLLRQFVNFNVLRFYGSIPGSPRVKKCSCAPCVPSSSVAFFSCSL